MVVSTVTGTVFPSIMSAAPFLVSASLASTEMFSVVVLMKSSISLTELGVSVDVVVVGVVVVVSGDVDDVDVEGVDV